SFPWLTLGHGKGGTWGFSPTDAPFLVVFPFPRVKLGQKRIFTGGVFTNRCTRGTFAVMLCGALPAHRSGASPPGHNERNPPHEVPERGRDVGNGFFGRRWGDRDGRPRPGRSGHDVQRTRRRHHLAHRSGRPHRRELLLGRYDRPG